MFEPTSGGGSIVGLNNVVSNVNSYVIGTGISTTLDNTSYVNNLSSLGFVSAPVLSGRYLYGDGSRLSNIYTAPSAATFSASVSAPAMSGTFYGDGSNLTGVLRSSGGGNLNGNVTINNGNLTVFGNISATGNSTFVNTTFTTTSALSVVNTGGGVALWIGGNNNADIASFYDIDQGKEVLHIGGYNSSTQVPYIGINTSSPNKTLTVVGEVSATNGFFGTTGTFYSSVSAPSIAGNGSNLNSLNASQLTTGTVNNSLLSSAATFSSYVSSPALSGTHYGDGTFLSNIKDSTKLNLTGGVVSNYLHLGTGSLVISAGDLTLGSGNITTPGSVAIGGSLVRSKLDLNNKVIAGVGNIRGNADTGAWSLWGGLGVSDTDVNGGNIALYGGSHPSTPNVVIINSSAGVESARFNANGISLAKPLTANSGLTLFGNLSTNNSAIFNTLTSTSASITNSVSITGSTTVTGNISASGSATFNSLTALGNVTSGSSTIKGNLSASGTITSIDLTLKSTAAQEGGQLNFARPSDNATSFILDVYSDVANADNSRLRIFNGVTSSELMTVLSSGNVGIGTSAPSYKLEVNGGSFFNNLTSNSSVSFINGNTRIAKNVVDNGLEFFTFNASRMFIADSTGNVGIGTVTPGTKLTVNGDISSNGNITASSLYGDGSNLTGLYKPSTLIASFVTAVSAPALSGNIGTFNTSVSAPALSGTHYGDGSNLTFNTGLTINTFVSATSLSAQAGTFSTSNMLLGQNEGGAYFGRTGIKEQQLYLMDGSIGTNFVQRGVAWKPPYKGVAMSSDGKYQTAVAGGNGILAYYIYRSTDYGVTWSVNYGAYSVWRDVAMSTDGKYQIACSADGKISVSYDYGITWSANRGPVRTHKAVAMSSDGKYQTVVENSGGRIYTSLNFGATTFTTTGPTLDYRGIAMSSNGKYQTAVAYGSQIYISTDYGTNWNPYGISQNYYDIAMSADGKYQTAVTAAGIYTSNNYGSNWTLNNYFSTTAFIKAKMSSDGRIQIVLSGLGQLYKSTDWGTTWVLADSASNYVAAAISSDSKVITLATNIDEPGSGDTYVNVGYLYASYTDSVLQGNLTITTSVSAPMLSGTHYGDGSKLTGIDLSTKLPLSASSYIAAIPGDNLLTKYAAATALTPNGLDKSTSNRAVLLIYPGTYNLGANVLNLTTEFVDVIGVTGDPSHVIINSSASVTLSCSNTLNNCLTKAVTLSGITSYVPGPSNTLSSKMDSIIFAQDMQWFGTYPGTYTNCTANGSYSFGGNGVASGTFTNCIVTGNNAFGGGGGSASGIFTNCTATGTNAFGGGTAGIASGIFSNCIATGGYSFGGGASNVSGTFTNCTATGNYAFGGNASAGSTTITGIFSNCTANGSFAFGWFGSSIAGKFINCRTNPGNFPTLGSGGIQINCVDGFYNIIEGAG